MFALYFHAKMHLRFGSEAADTGSNGGDVGGKHRGEGGRLKTSKDVLSEMEHTEKQRNKAESNTKN